MDNLQTQYDRMTSEREGFLNQARKSSELTLPYLIPPDGHSGNPTYNDLYKPFQSAGSFGVKSLSNKLALALFPAQEPFFKFIVNTSSEEMEGVDPEAISQIDSQLSQLERTILEKFASRGDRASIVEAMNHLIVGGNAVIYIGEKASRVYGLDNFVISRDGYGNVLKLIMKDCLDYETFTEKYGDSGIEDIKQAHKGNRSWTPSTIDVYTGVCRKDGRWKIEQQAKGKTIPGTKGDLPIDKPPFVAPRLSKISGQSYGRGYVEDLYGDLSSLEQLSKAMTEGGAIAALNIIFVNPNGLTSIKKVTEAQNGDVIPGSAEDVSAFQAQKDRDAAVVFNQIQSLTVRLDRAFLLTQSAQRDAERVTAFEIGQVVEELETVLGGAYTVLAEEFQKPFVVRLIDVLMKGDEIPPLPEDVVEPVIITGLSALGRGIDKNRIVEFITILSQALGPQALSMINPTVAMEQLATSMGLNAAGLIKSQEQMAEEQQQAQQASLAQAAAPQATSAMGNVAVEAMKQSQPTPEEGAPTDAT